MSETVIYVVMRRDLNMRRGKEIAQACHAVLGLGVEDDGAVVGLQVPDLNGLYDLLHEAEVADINCHLVRDAGRTEIEPGTETCIAIGPVVRGFLPLLSEAKLY